jgi:hypothetical protein
MTTKSQRNSIGRLRLQPCLSEQQKHLRRLQTGLVQMQTNSDKNSLYTKLVILIY